MLGPVASPHQVVVIHDATVKALPGNFSWKFRAAYGLLVPILCRVADKVVTVSDFSRHELGKYYGARIDRIPVCYEGCDHIVVVKPDLTIIERLGLKGRRFFLGVGINSYNKNLDNTVAAFLQSGLDDSILVLTGSREARVHGQLSSAEHERVRMTGFVSDSELRALYEAATALVFASRYEGFGLPPIEAMRCGCPVIISDQPALVEVGGDAVLQCGMDDVPALARAMHDVQSDAALSDRLKQAGFARAKKFTWDNTARTLLDLCLDVEKRRAA
jgi:glycosyltransferase involved in cell wall biosynthesis